MAAPDPEAELARVRGRLGPSSRPNASAPSRIRVPADVDTEAPFARLQINLANFGGPSSHDLLDRAQNLYVPGFDELTFEHRSIFRKKSYPWRHDEGVDRENLKSRGDLSSRGRIVYLIEWLNLGREATHRPRHGGRTGVFHERRSLRGELLEEPVAHARPPRVAAGQHHVGLNEGQVAVKARGAADERELFQYVTHEALFVQLDSPPGKPSPVDEQAVSDKIGMQNLRDPAFIQSLQPRAVVVGGRPELQRTQQRLELIARYRKDLLTDLPIDEIEAEVRLATRHGTPDTTRTRSPPNGLRRCNPICPGVPGMKVLSTLLLMAAAFLTAIVFGLF